MTAAELRRWLSEDEWELYLVLHPDIGDGNRKMQVLESLAEQRWVTVEAIKLIKLWHNMNPLGHIADGMAEKAWEIYYSQAPEMKEIRECIAEYPRGVKDVAKN